MPRNNPILTYTNTMFYPLAPRTDEVKTEDIAHALSQMCRANGHFKSFYSVAQHSINCAQEAEARGLSVRVRLACLLHDASEAYISDITRPVKYFLEDYKKIEQNLQKVIYSKFGIDNLTSMELRQIDEIDNALLEYEFKNLHHQGFQKNPPPIFSLPDVSEKNMASVEHEFICLTRQIQEALQQLKGTVRIEAQKAI
ncbi:MAG: hypothetical protein H6Q65_645 [Firmicutes bacterium]|nr:hypothetical protein [Bacillota bacterium]